MRLERDSANRGYRVLVDANELVVPSKTFGGTRLPYATWVGFIRDDGRIDVWTPAAYVPRGYKAAARALLEKAKTEVMSKDNPNVTRPWASVFRSGLAEPSDAPRSVRLYLERVKLDSGGYDSRGRYFGLGLPLYRASDDRGDVDVELRATDRAHAKDLVRRRLGPKYDVRFTR